MGNNILQLNPEEIKRIEQYRQSKKTAVLTILFTDIVGYTNFTEEAGENIATKFRHIHDELFTKAMTRDGAGEIIKQIGDSFLAIFSEPSTAVNRALEFQKCIFDNKNNLSYRGYILKVRVGIHLGQVSLEDAIQPDIFGGQVNKASRIMSIARGGQILTSQSVWENASGWLKKLKGQLIETRSFGKVNLKSITQPVNIYEFFYRIIGTQGTPYVIGKFRRERFYKWIVGSILSITIMFTIGHYAGIWGKIYWAFTNEDPNRMKRIYIPNIISNNEDVNHFTKLIRGPFGQILEPWNDTLTFTPLSDSLKSVISSAMIQPIINVVDPDYVVINEYDIKKEFAKKGLTPPMPTFSSIVIQNDFLQKINCDAGINVHIYSIQDDDYPYEYAILLGQQISGQRFNIFVANGDSLLWNIINPIKGFRQTAKREYGPIGKVISLSEEQILISLDKSPNNRIGTLFYLARDYQKTFKNLDTLRIVQDFDNVIDFYKTLEDWELAFGENGKYTASNYWSPENYKKITEHKQIILSGIGLAINVELVELFDTTAIVRIVEKEYPWVTPAINDDVWRQCRSSSSKRYWELDGNATLPFERLSPPPPN